MITKLSNRVNAALLSKKGATAVEYALLIGLVAIVIIVALVALGPVITSFIDGIDLGT